MTDEERWQIEGRTRDQLRQAKFALAALHADLADHARKLREASEGLDYFLSNPVGRGPTGMLNHEYVIHFWSQLLSRELQRKVREYTETAERVETLEKRVAEFE